jgi:hypothetical protein
MSSTVITASVSSWTSLNSTSHYPSSSSSTTSQLTILSLPSTRSGDSGTTLSAPPSIISWSTSCRTP